MGTFSGMSIYKDDLKYYFTNNSKSFQFSELDFPSLKQLSKKRLSDFSTGRYCAMKALEQLGINNVIIPLGKDREPIWPEGIVGSISHCGSITGAIVAKSTDYISLGLDIEEIGEVTPDLWDLVFTENEKAFLLGLNETERLVRSTVIFSAKEAYYKFQHPLTKTFLDFLDVEVSLPDFSQVNIFSNKFIIDTDARNNKITYFIDNKCVVAIVSFQNITHKSNNSILTDRIFDL